ncbi:MAG TPA: hypothetical protein VIY49_26700 [Bryobacteraceae bacterium]
MFKQSQIGAAVALIITATAVSFGQTATQKAPTAPPKPDTWERSKECAAQAEKVVADRDRRTAAFGGHSADWTNHYSPKYNRCFVTVLYMADPKTAVKGAPVFNSFLIDAFERSSVASSACCGSPEILCHSGEDAESCRRIWQSACKIEDQETDCEKAKQFIEEHMKN